MRCFSIGIRLRRILCLALCLALLLCTLPAQAEYRELSTGMSGRDVLALKQAMYYLGYFTSLNLSDSYNDIMAQRVKNLQKANGLPETGVADAALQELVFSGQCKPTKGAPKPTAVPTPAPTPIVPQNLPGFPQLTEQGFLPEGQEPYVYINKEDGLWIYKSDALSVEVRRCVDNVETLTWYETEVYCTPESPLTTCMTEGKVPGWRCLPPAKLADNNNAVLALTDDFFAARRNNKRTVGIVIRNGEVISDKTLAGGSRKFPNLDVLAVFNDGSMKAFASDAHTAQEYLDMGVTNTFAFGPILVSDGQLGPLMTDNTYYYGNEPRCAIGMIEPYHYIILTVRGRAKDSGGVYFRWLADKMLEKGAVEAMNLDGGGTVALVFMGKMINKTTTNPREVNSLITFGSTK